MVPGAVALSGSTKHARGHLGCQKAYVQCAALSWRQHDAAICPGLQLPRIQGPHAHDSLGNKLLPCLPVPTSSSPGLMPV